MEKTILIDKIINKEWLFFSNAENLGGKAECQENKDDFDMMRRAQWMTLNNEVLESYYNDLTDAENQKLNLIVEKYARMMEYNMPSEFVKIKHALPEISKEKNDIVNKILDIYMSMEKEFFEKYPKIAALGRPLHSEADSLEDTSIETYLRGELLSYSLKTLELYYSYILKSENENINLALENMENVFKLQGFDSLEEVNIYIENNKQ